VISAHSSHGPHTRNSAPLFCGHQRIRALRSPCGTPLHVLLNPTFLAFDLNDGKCAPIVNEWRRRAQHEPQPLDRCQVRRFPSRKRSTILGSLLRLVVLCSAAEARVVMELFSEVRMGSLLSRTPVQIPRRHWPVALEIRAVAESPAAALSPCLRRPRRPSFLGSADSSTDVILFPSSHPRIPSCSPSLLNLTRHIPRPETAAPNPPNWLAVTSSLVLFTHPFGPQNL
jgi:hypothetical protein